MIEQVALWAEILGGAAVIGGILFGLVQLRLLRRQRTEQAAVEVVRSMLTSHFPVGYRLLNHLPDGVSVAEVRAKGSEYEDAIFSIATVFETLGYLVYRRIVPLDVARELVGGVAVALWRKVGPYAAELGAMEGQERLVEWYEWLVHQLEARDASFASGRASDRFALWRP